MIIYKYKFPFSVAHMWASDNWEDYNALEEQIRTVGSVGTEEFCRSNYSVSSDCWFHYNALSQGTDTLLLYGN